MEQSNLVGSETVTVAEKAQELGIELDLEALKGLNVRKSVNDTFEKNGTPGKGIGLHEVEYNARLYKRVMGQYDRLIENKAGKHSAEKVEFFKKSRIDAEKYFTGQSEEFEFLFTAAFVGNEDRKWMQVRIDSTPENSFEKPAYYKSEDGYIRPAFKTALGLKDPEQSTISESVEQYEQNIAQKEISRAIQEAKDLENERRMIEMEQYDEYINLCNENDKKPMTFSEWQLEAFILPNEAELERHEDSPATGGQKYRVLPGGIIEEE